jgi:hypothetical protein
LVAEKAALASERSLKVLSADSKRGHEAVSLAMTLAASGLVEKGWKISVIGFDPDPWQVKLAKEAKFSQKDLAFLHPSTARRWFQPRYGGWGLKPSLGLTLEFFKANHAEIEGGPLEALAGSVDVVFCRGLSFDCPDHLVGRLVRNMTGLLADGGILMSAPGEFFSAAGDCRVEIRDGVAYLRRVQAKSKINTFFASRPAKVSGRPAMDLGLPAPDQLDRALAGRFEELLEPDPDEAREVVLELLSREMDRGGMRGASLGLMRSLEERLGRWRRAEALQEVLAAWGQGED